MEKDKAIISSYFSQIAKKRWAKVTPEERKEYAKKIAKLPRKRKAKESIEK